MRIYTKKQFDKELESRMCEREREIWASQRIERLEKQIEDLRCQVAAANGADAETVVHCNLEENARVIALVLDFDAEGKVFDWYEQHIKQSAAWYEQHIKDINEGWEYHKDRVKKALLGALSAVEEKPYLADHE